jgi:hypothetical protein
MLRQVVIRAGLYFLGGSNLRVPNRTGASDLGLELPLTRLQTPALDYQADRIRDSRLESREGHKSKDQLPVDA